jgi:hypothetical protein
MRNRFRRPTGRNALAPIITKAAPIAEVYIELQNKKPPISPPSCCLLVTKAVKRDSTLLRDLAPISGGFVLSV